MAALRGWVRRRPGVLIAIRRGGRVLLPGVATTQTREWYDDAHDVTTIDGIRCSTIARTVADLARYHPPRHERAADDFQRRGYSLGWMEQTLDRIPRRRGDGLDRAYTDLAQRRNGGRVRESWFEQLVEQCISSPRIPASPGSSR